MNLQIWYRSNQNVAPRFWKNSLRKEGNAISMKFCPKYEVSRANIMNRETYPHMVSILSKLLIEETLIISQATMEGKEI